MHMKSIENLQGIGKIYLFSKSNKYHANHQEISHKNSQKIFEYI